MFSRVYNSRSSSRADMRFNLNEYIRDFSRLMMVTSIVNSQSTLTTSTESTSVYSNAHCNV